MKIQLEKLEYEYVFKDEEQLYEQIKMDMEMKYPTEAKTLAYEIYETDDKIIVELYSIIE